jgi:hypothetical protein
MSCLEEAIARDIDEDYLFAVALYEEAVARGNPSLDAIINGAFLYWQFTEYGFNCHYRIPTDYVKLGGDRYGEILDIGISLHPRNCELHFWKAYLHHRLIFDPLTEEDVLAIVRTYGDTSLMPYFFLYLFDKEKYKKERDLLLEDCSHLLTAKNRYIISIIEDRPYERSG